LLGLKGSLNEYELDLLRQRSLSARYGATVDEVAGVTGWQRHTVRGVFSGTLKKKLGLTLASAKEERGRVYRIAEPASA